MPSIPLTGLSVNDPVPGNYVEINFAQGPTSGASGLRAILLIGNKTTAGSATPDTTIYGPPSPLVNTSPQPLGTVQDAINLFGQGSELHRMYKRALAINTTTPVYAIAVTESVGAASTLAVTIASAATANGFARAFVGDEFVDAPITSGDTAIAIAGSIVAAVNSKLDWPVTAANSGTAVVTFTSKNKGLRANWLRGNVVIFGSNIATTSSVTTPTFFASGTTADSNVTALATILSYRFYYIVSAAEDATQFGALVSQVNTQALPTTGNRQVCFAGSIDTIGNLTTIATGINGARAEITWLAQADWTPAEIAANQAAVEALYESASPPRLNFDGFGLAANDGAAWKIRAPRSGAQPTRANLVSALNNGITPIGVLPNGSTYLVKRVTTRSLSGANADYRIRDSHKVRVCDFFGDDLLAKFAAQFQGKVIGDDPVPGQRVPGPQVATPRQIKACAWKLIDDYADKDMLQSRDAIKAGVICNREPGTTSRISMRVPLQPIDVLDQVTAAVDQVA